MPRRRNRRDRPCFVFLPAKPVTNTRLARLDRDGEALLFVSARPLAARYRSGLAVALFEPFRVERCEERD